MDPETSQPIEVRPASDESERAAFGELASWSFGVNDAAGTREWTAMFPLSDIWIATRRGVLVGGLALARGAQLWGGRAVPWVGVSGVRTASEARGRGLSQRLLGDALKAEAAAGIGLAALYPASLELYRKSGFELAGVSSVLRLRLKELVTRRSGFRAESITRDQVIAFWAAHGPHENGNLQRESALWARLWRPAAHPPKLFGLVADSGELRAVVGLAVERHDTGFDLPIRFWAARDAAAIGALHGLLAEHGTLGRHSDWWGAPLDPLVRDLGAEHWSTVRVQPWMLRVLDPCVALEARGYPAGMSARLVLALTDPLGGDVSLELGVSDGVGRVAPADADPAALVVGARGLAALYAGARSAESLADAGLVQGPPEVLRRASALFAGPTAWIPEMF